MPRRQPCWWRGRICATLLYTTLLYTPSFFYPPYFFGDGDDVSRRVAGVGVDTASIDAGSSKDFIVHKILLSNGIYGIENINTHLGELPPRGSTLFVMPMKIGGGSGAPARVCALIP